MIDDVKSLTKAYVVSREDFWPVKFHGLVYKFLGQSTNESTNRPTNRPTDRPTYQHTNILTHPSTPYTKIKWEQVGHKVLCGWFSPYLVLEVLMSKFEINIKQENYVSNLNLPEQAKSNSIEAVIIMSRYVLCLYNIWLPRQISYIEDNGDWKLFSCVI